MSTSRRSVVHLLASATASVALAPACASRGSTLGKGGSGPGSDDGAGTGGDDGIIGAGTGGGTGGSGGTGGTGGGDCVATSGDVEGPYYTADAPEVTALAGADEPGVRIVIDGLVVDAADCETPLPGAVVDLWHADDDGLYDNVGYHLRGRLTADSAGAFRIETILPGRYETRPVRHIHFKVWSAEGEEVLTSQIYFEGDESHNPAAHPGPVVGLDGEGRGRLLLAVPVTA